MTMRLGEATIEQGTISNDVKTIQQILTGQGYNVGPIDGNFGPQTKAAVQAFQSSHGLVPDGIVGPLTWAALKGQTPETPQAPAPSPAPAPAPTPARVILAAPSRLSTLSNVSSIAGLGVGLFALVLATMPTKRRRRK